MNRKKHTPVYRRIGVAALLSVGILSLGCWPRHADPIPPRANVIKPAESRPSPGPAVDQAGKKGAEADAQAAVTASKIASANANALSAREQMREAVAEADRLRKQKTASENELVALYNRLVAQDKQMGIMLADIASARDSLVQERKLRQEATDLLAQARKQIEAKDNEATLLRFQLDQASADAKANADIANELNANLSKARTQAATAEGRVTTWFRIAMAMLGMFILSLILHVVRSYIRI